MKTNGEVDVSLHAFLTQGGQLVRDEWLVSRSGRFIPGKKPLLPTEQEAG
jgi:hypothetical protein